jgi:hypothetical protein
MLYLLLEEEDGYISSIDHGYSYWKKVAEFEAESREEAVSQIPTNRYGRYRIYEISSWPAEYEVKQKDIYEVKQL